jgi:hypothetical protein
MAVTMKGEGRHLPGCGTVYVLSQDGSDMFLQNVSSHKTYIAPYS